MRIVKLKSILLVAMFLAISGVKAQMKETKATWGEGVVVIGYVDDGAYVNFTGPAFRYSRKTFSLSAGLLPSLRLKEDKSESETKNSLITPSLGFGLTGVYKHLAVQVPFFYNPRTASHDGKWNVGAGIGYKF